MGGTAVKHILPNIFRLLTAMTQDEVDPNETWQITEANRLLDDVPLLRRSLAKYGAKVPDAAWYLTNKYLGPDIKANERDMRTNTVSGHHSDHIQSLDFLLIDQENYVMLIQWFF